MAISLPDFLALQQKRSQTQAEPPRYETPTSLKRQLEAEASSEFPSFGTQFGPDPDCLPSATQQANLLDTLMISIGNADKADDMFVLSGLSYVSCTGKVRIDETVVRTSNPLSNGVTATPSSFALSTNKKGQTNKQSTVSQAYDYKVKVGTRGFVNVIEAYEFSWRYIFWTHEQVDEFFEFLRGTELGKLRGDGRVSARPRKVNHPIINEHGVETVMIVDYQLTARDPQEGKYFWTAEFTLREQQEVGEDVFEPISDDAAQSGKIALAGGGKVPGLVQSPVKQPSGKKPKRQTDVSIE